MKSYLVTIACTLVLAFLSERICVGDFNSHLSKALRKWTTVGMVVVLACFIGLRTAYNDTAAYISSYESLITFPAFWNTFDITLGENPGFQLCNATLKYFNVSWHGMLLFYAFITTGSAVWLLKKYSPDFTISLFLLFTTNAYTLTGAALKQCLAISIGVFAIPFALKKQWIPFTLIILLASTFHPYILMYLVIPLLTFRPWTKWTYVLIVCALLSGYLFEYLANVIIDIAAFVGDTYDKEKVMGEGIGALRVLVSMAPLILTFIYQRGMFVDKDAKFNVFVNLSTINAVIMFVGIFGSSIAFSRLAGYFTIMQAVSLPWILRKITVKDRQIWKTLMVVGYCGFFLYANIFASSFDDGFSRITLWEYIGGVIAK